MQTGPNTPGPKTEQGKARSAKNALTHGLAGRTVVLPTEDLNLYRELSARIVADLHPATALEHELAQSIADGHWRLRRLRSTEDALFANGEDDYPGWTGAEAAFTAAKALRRNPQAFHTLSLYEQRISRTIEKAMAQLRQLKAERNELHISGDASDESSAPEKAPEREISHPGEFVYSSTEIESRQPHLVPPRSPAEAFQPDPLDTAA